MNTLTSTKNKPTNNSLVLSTILREIQFLRKEVEILLPQEDLKGYAHPKRIVNSLSKALKKYPLMSHENH